MPKGLAGPSAASRNATEVVAEIARSAQNCLHLHTARFSKETLMIVSCWISDDCAYRLGRHPFIREVILSCMFGFNPGHVGNAGLGELGKMNSLEVLTMLGN